MAISLALVLFGIVSTFAELVDSKTCWELYPILGGFLEVLFLIFCCVCLFSYAFTNIFEDMLGALPDPGGVPRGPVPHTLKDGHVWPRGSRCDPNPTPNPRPSNSNPLVISEVEAAAVVFGIGLCWLKYLVLLHMGEDETTISLEPQESSRERMQSFGNHHEAPRATRKPPQP